MRRSSSKNREPFGIDLTVRSAILIAKDRPGQLRKHGHRRKDGLDYFGDVIVASHDKSYSEFEIQPPQERASEFKPTHLMAKICAALATHGPMSQRKILATVGGKYRYTIDALALLQRDGYVSDETPHKLIKPWDGTTNNEPLPVAQALPNRCPATPQCHRCPVAPLEGATADGQRSRETQIQEPSVAQLWIARRTSA